MSKPTNPDTVMFVRKLYDEGQPMHKIGDLLGFSPVWIRHLLLKTGGTRPRGHNLRKDNHQEVQQPAQVG